MLQFAKGSLGGKIATGIGAVLIVIFIILAITNTVYQTGSISKSEEESAKALASTVLGAIRYPMLEGEQEIIQKQE